MSPEFFSEELWERNLFYTFVPHKNKNIIQFKIISNVESIPSLGDVRKVLITEKDGSTREEYKSQEWIELHTILNQVDDVLGHVLGKGFKNPIMEKLNESIEAYASSQRETAQH